MTRARQTPASATSAAAQTPATAPIPDDPERAEGQPTGPRAGADGTDRAVGTHIAAGTDHADGEARRSMIAIAAYYRAERRGFADGQAEGDWFAAEQEVDLLLNGPTPDTPS